MSQCIPALPGNRTQETRRKASTVNSCITMRNGTAVHSHKDSIISQPEHRNCFNSVMIVVRVIERAISLNRFPSKEQGNRVQVELVELCWDVYRSHRSYSAPSRPARGLIQFKIYPSNLKSPANSKKGERSCYYWNSTGIVLRAREGA